MSGAKPVVAVGADNAGAELKNQLKGVLEATGQVEVRDFGVPDATDPTAYPHVGLDVAEAVARGEAWRGLLVCGTGIGMAITANKVPGVRAALCTDAETARGARRWNDANVLALGMRLTTPDVAAEILDAFLATAPDPDEAGAIGRVEAG